MLSQSVKGLRWLQFSKWMRVYSTLTLITIPVLISSENIINQLITRQKLHSPTIYSSENTLKITLTTD